MTDVVVTRIGVETIAGEIGSDDELEQLGARCRRSGRLRDVDARVCSFDPSAAELRSLSRFGRIGYLAAARALEGISALGPRGGVSIGTAAGPMSELRDSFDRAFSGRRFASPGYAVARHMPSVLPSLLLRRLGGRHGGSSVSCGCTSGLLALRDAVSAIRAGDVDWFLVGAVEEDSPHYWLAFDQQRLLATRGHGVPYDAATDGFVPAGGAAFLLVESARHAEDHARAPLARIAAAHHAMAPTPEGSFLRLDAAAYGELARSTGDRVDVLAPHAPGTSADPDELAALAEAVAWRAIASNRHALGYAVAASGLIDVAFAIDILRTGYCPPVTGIEALDERAAPYRATLEGARDVRSVLKTAYAIGGGIAAVRLEAP